MAYSEKRRRLYIPLTDVEHAIVKDASIAAGYAVQTQYMRDLVVAASMEKLKAKKNPSV